MLYIKFRCHVTADVKLFIFSTRCSKSFEQSYLLNSALLILRQCSCNFSPQVIFIGINKVQQHDVFKFQSGALEVFRSWRQRITGVWGTEVRPVGSKGKAPLEGMGDKVPLEDEVPQKLLIFAYTHLKFRHLVMNRTELHFIPQS